MTQWADISGRGTCFRRGDPDAVGGHVALAWKVAYWWEFACERVNKTGRTQLKHGQAEDAHGARAKADSALAALDSHAQGELFGGTK